MDTKETSDSIGAEGVLEGIIKEPGEGINRMTLRFLELKDAPETLIGVPKLNSGDSEDDRSPTCPDIDDLLTDFKALGARAVQQELLAIPTFRVNAECPSVIEIDGSAFSGIALDGVMEAIFSISPVVQVKY